MGAAKVFHHSGGESRCGCRGRGRWLDWMVTFAARAKKLQLLVKSGYTLLAMNGRAYHNSKRSFI